MFQRNLILILIVVLSVITPLGAAYILEFQAESLVTDILQEQNIKAENVSFDYADDVLEIRNLSGPTPYAPNGTFSIGLVKILVPNPEALEEDVQGHPLVAQEIIIQNLKSTYTMLGEQVTSETEELHIIGWKQNLPQLFAVSDDANKFVTAMLNLYVESIETKNSRSTSIMAGVTTESTIKSSSIKNITPQSMGASVVNDISLVATEKGKEGQKVYTNIASIESGPVDMPAANFINFLLSSIEANQSNPFEGSKETELVQHLRNYFANGTKPAMTVKGITVTAEDKGEKKEIFALGNVDFQAQYDAIKAKDLTFSFNAQDISVNINLLGLDKDQSMLAKNLLASETLHINTDMQGNFKATSTENELSASFGVKGLGDITLDFELILPLKSFAPIFASKGMEGLETFLSKLLVAKASLSYKDAGLTPRLLIEVSKRASFSLEEAYAVSIPMVEKEIGFLQTLILKPEGYAALLQCIQNPGTLNLSLDYAEPSTFEGLLSRGFKAPLTTQCMPGEPVVKAAEKLMQN